MMDKLKNRSPRNQFPTIIVKSSNSSVSAIENDDVDDGCDDHTLSFHYSFRPLYFFSRFVGLMPFSVTQSLNGNGLSARVTVYDLIWFILSIVISISLGVIDTTNIRLPQNSNESLTINVGDHLLLIFGLSVGTLSVALDMFNRKRLVNIVESFETFDREVSSIYNTITLHIEFYVAVQKN